MSKATTRFAAPHEGVKIVRISRGEGLELPPENTGRWVTRRKAQVVAAVRNNLLTLEEACKRYSLSEEEFNSWMRRLEHHGQRGLRATRTQDYRREEDPVAQSAGHAE